MKSVSEMVDAMRAAGVTPDTGRAEARERLRGVKATLSSPCHQVSVTISGTGELLDVTIAGGAFRKHSTSSLATTVTDTIRTACDLVVQAGHIALR